MITVSATNLNLACEEQPVKVTQPCQAATARTFGFVRRKQSRKRSETNIPGIKVRGYRLKAHKDGPIARIWNVYSPRKSPKVAEAKAVADVVLNQ